MNDFNKFSIHIIFSSLCSTFELLYSYNKICLQYYVLGKISLKECKRNTNIIYSNNNKLIYSFLSYFNESWNGNYYHRRVFSKYTRVKYNRILKRIYIMINAAVFTFYFFSNQNYISKVNNSQESNNRFRTSISFLNFLCLNNNYYVIFSRCSLAFE